MAAGPERTAATMVAALGALRGLPGEVRRRVCEEAWWWDLRAPLGTALSGAGPPHASGFDSYAAEGSFLCMAWSPDGRQLAAGCFDGTEDGRAAISVWDVASGPAPTRACLKGGDHDPDVADSYGNDSDDGDVRKGKPPCGCEGTVDEDSGFYCNAQGCPLPGHADGVVALAFSPDGTTLLSASYDLTVRLWGRMSGPSEAWEQTGCLLAGGPPPTEDESGYEPHHIAWSPDGSRVLACLRESGGGYIARRLQVWDVPGPGQPPLRPSLEVDLSPSSQLFVAAFSPGGGAVVASDGRRLIRWDLAAGGKTTQEWPMEGANSDVRVVRISPDASCVAVCLAAHPNPTVAVWSVVEGGVERVREIRTGLGCARYRMISLAISPDNQYVLLGSDKVTEMWSVQTGRRVWADEDPAGRSWVVSAAFSPDGRSFAIAKSNAPVELWR